MNIRAVSMGDKNTGVESAFPSSDYPSMSGVALIPKTEVLCFHLYLYIRRDSGFLILSAYLN